MALRRKVLRIKAEKVEQKALKKHKINQERVCVLDAIFHEYYVISRPVPNDYKARTDLVQVFNEIAKEIYGKYGEVPTVVEFGSFVMDLFSVRSDLDLSVNFIKKGVEVTREKKIQTLRKFARKFYALQSKGHVFGVHPIPSAKVPILKVVDRGTRVECDLSVENRDGILKSQLIRMICTIDERFQTLSFLMKGWAKAQKINSSRDGTLNSLSIVLLVAFHLQTRRPPILPPFSALFRDGLDPTSVSKLLNNFINYGKCNKETVAELFISFLIKLSSVEILWPKGLCACVYDASWTSKTWDSKVAPISVEDFTDRTQNVARAVGVSEMKQIYKCIHNSLKHVFAFMDGKIESSKLLVLFFGKDAKIPQTVPNAVPPRVITPSIPAQDASSFPPCVVDSKNEPSLDNTNASSCNSVLTKRPSSSVNNEGEIHSSSWKKGGIVTTPLGSAMDKRIQCVGDWDEMLTDSHRKSDLREFKRKKARF